MSSRFPPTSSDSRYPPRDHSPSGSLDRRTSSAYNSTSLSRNSELPYRGSVSHGHSSQGRDILREAPRGPKATLDTSRGGGFVPRGRGYSARGDLRDTRDVSFQNRDDNREWSRREGFENRDRRPSPIIRNRSRTPPTRDHREPRDLPVGHLDLSRVQRGSRDGPLSASSTTSEAALSAGFYGRGGHRGRGRGDWESRGRGRGNFSDDRDIMRNRSRSRERMWDRESREERTREVDRETGRRDDEKRYPKKDWERDADRFRHDTPPPRPGSRASSGSYTRPPTPHSVSILPSSLSNVERSTFRSTAPTGEGTRRPSTASVGTESSLREDSKSHQAVCRAESSRPLPAVGSPTSPPRPTQVPAFGSTTYKAPITGHTTGSHIPPQREEPPSSAPARFDITDPIRAAPKAPKAELAQAQPPTGPKGGPLFARRSQPGTAPSARAYDGHNDTRPSIQSGNSNVSNVAIGRFTAPQRSAVSQTFPPTPSIPAGQNAWSANSRSMLQNANRSGPAESSTMANNIASEQTGRFNHSDLQSKAPSGSSVALSPARVPPRGPKANTQPSIRAPMAPRLQHNTWVNPKLRPSIMNTMPSTAATSLPVKRDYTGEERSNSRLISQSTKQNPHVVSKLNVEYQQSKAEMRQPESLRVEESEKHYPKDEHSTFPAVSVSPHEVFPVVDMIEGIHNQPSSGSEEDDGMNLDEDDFKEAEKNHTREVQKLNSKRPSTPRHHAELLPLLEELDALASAAEDLASGLIQNFDERTEIVEGDLPLGLPSPEPEKDQVQSDTNGHGKVRDFSGAESPVLSEHLPFLVSGPPTPLSEVSVIQKGFVSHERIKDQLMDVISKKRSQMSFEYEELRAEYARLYKDWKLGVEALDQEKKLQDETTGATPSPVPTEAPGLPVPVIETRRAGRAYNMSELDVLRVMEISKKETAEAEELRERQAQKNTSFADLQREAVVPDMLNHFDARFAVFEDTNHLIPTGKALEALAFSEPIRKLTEQEHEAFDRLYMNTPKKWGLIAEAFPEYDYQDIIKHYYITKHDPVIGKYKDRLNKISVRGKPVTRGRGKGGRGKPTALMGRGGAMYDGPGTDVASPPRTQAGRPKRIAAPTFGERETLSENDPTTMVPTPARRGAGSNRTETGGDASSDRPVIKRTRTTQRSDKGTKRSKAPLLAAAPVLSLPRKEIETGRSKSKEPKIEEQPQILDLEEPQVLLLPDVPQAPIQGNWSNGPRPLNPPAVCDIKYAPPPPPPIVTVQQQQQFSQEPHGRVSTQTSSYWSVPEQLDFVKLVEFYGTDWQQISQTLKTKTHTMVKNHYFREIDKGKTELQIMAETANQKIKRGEQIDNPPQPSLMQKRRTDAIPHTNPQRPLAPNAEAMDIEMGSPVYHSSATLQVSPSHHGQSAPRLAPLLQAGAVPNVGSLNTMTHGVGGTNVPVQSTPPSQRSSQSLQGPRAGFFPAERSSQPIAPPGPTTARSQQPSHQHVHQQQPPQRSQVPNFNKHEFEAEMARLHKAKHEHEDHRTMPLYSQPPEQQTHVPISSHVESNQHASSLLHGRTVPSASLDLERKQRITMQQQQSPIDPSPPSLRRSDLRGQASVLPTHAQSPQNVRPIIMSPSQEVIRPSSVPANTINAPVQPPPKQPPVQAKRSNIMSILNDEPSDPQPRKSLGDHRLLAATPPPRSPASSAPMYQQPSQLLPQYSRRDPIVEATQIPPPPPPVQQQQTQQPHLAYQQLPQHLHQQMQHQQHQTQPHQQVAQHSLQQRPPQQQRDPGNNWPAAVQRPYIEQRSSFQQHTSVPISPHVQPAFLQPPTRNTFQPLQPVQAPSPPLLSTHSRASSYTGLHPQQSHQQTGTLQSSQPLQPSPYAQMHPLQYPQQLQPHPQQSQQPRPQSAFAISSTPQEHLLRQQQQQPHHDVRQQDAMRQHELRHQDTLRYENPMRLQAQQQQQIQQQQQQEMARQEQSRVQSMQRPYSPPQYTGRGGYKTGLQQLPDQIRKPRGYEDPR